MSKGYKKVVLYIPNYAEYGIKNFEIKDEYSIVRKRRTKVLFIGDSITQGAGTLRAGQAYVDITARELGYEIINQGIGGYVFDKNIIKKLNFKPRKIIVALGTNNIYYTVEENKRFVSEFFCELIKMYPNTPILKILPPFRGNNEQGQVFNERFVPVANAIRKAVSPYKDIKIVSAYDMIPNFKDYYLDDFIHPNAFGAEVYAKNLVKKITEIKF